ncbi:MAG: T9SS type A sorting domain-containing protein, partial [Bacteroidota bacterium]
YNARVLLSTVDSTVYMNDCEIVKPGKKSRSMEESSSVSDGEARGLSVFPNPANDKLNVLIHLEAGQVGTLEVFDLAGKLVLTHTLNSDSEVNEMSINILSEGLYIYKLNVNNSPVSSGKLSIIR